MASVIIMIVTIIGISFWVLFPIAMYLANQESKLGKEAVNNIKNRVLYVRRRERRHPILFIRHWHHKH